MRTDQAPFIFIEIAVTIIDIIILVGKSVVWIEVALNNVFARRNGQRISAYVCRLDKLIFQGRKFKFLNVSYLCNATVRIAITVPEIEPLAPTETDNSLFPTELNTLDRLILNVYVLSVPKSK